MKKTLIVTFLLFLVFTMVSAQTSFRKIAETAISQAGLRQATSLAEKLLLGQKTGNIYLLSEDEAIPEMSKGLTQGVQKSSYENIQSMFGEYESMQFAEVWQMEADQPYSVYRFRGTFDGTVEKPEIRVVLDKEGKLAGFWIMPWEDDLGGQP